jgi:prepilin-type N-terminal cleavage/methylation domain-containing protein
MNTKTTRNGFTLIEILLSLGLLGVILVALFRFLGVTTEASGSANASNDLLREGQIAQQIITTRLKEACYIYPKDAIITMGSTGLTTTNDFNPPLPNYDWKINTHPIVAMILPADEKDKDDSVTSGNFFRFYAYYAVKRSNYFSMGNSNSANPNRDALNDNTVWMIMEYRANLTITAGTTKKCGEMRGENIKSRTGRLLVDYVSPAASIDTMFEVGPELVTNQGATYVDYNLQFQKIITGGNVIRVGQNAGASNLRGRIYPQNIGL